MRVDEHTPIYIRKYSRNKKRSSSMIVSCCAYLVCVYVLVKCTPMYSTARHLVCEWWRWLMMCMDRAHNSEASEAGSCVVSKTTQKQQEQLLTRNLLNHINRSSRFHERTNQGSFNRPWNPQILQPTASIVVLQSKPNQSQNKKKNKQDRHVTSFQSHHHEQHE